MASQTLLSQLKPSNGPKSPNKKEKNETITISGLEEYAALTKVADEIDALIKSHPVREIVFDHFVDSGRKIQKTPPNVHGTDESGNATASLQLRKKDSRTNLNDATIQACTDAGITIEHAVVVPYAVIVNPAYMTKTDSLEKLLVMAKKAGFPDDFFQIQNEVAREIACNESVSDVFALKVSPEKTAELLKLVAGVTITAKWHGTLEEAVNLVNKELSPKKASRSDIPSGAPRSSIHKENKPVNLMEKIKASRSDIPAGRKMK
jgi:hypothetical protein